MPLWLRFASATAWAGALARPDEGYLFISNRPDEAVAAALRLRAVSPEANITFVSDSASLFDIDGGRAIFDVVIAAELAMPDIRLRDSMGFRLQKLRGMTVTPYERTIYMDSDTFACRAVDELFRTLERERADVACVWGGRGNHTGASAGVLAYSRSRASRALWAAWEEIYRQVMTTSRREQPSFQKAVAVTTLKEQLRVSKLAMSYNCRNVRNCAAARLKDRTIATQGCSVIHAHDFEERVEETSALSGSAEKRAPRSGSASERERLRARFAEPCPVLSGAHRLVLALARIAGASKFEE